MSLRVCMILMTALLLTTVSIGVAKTPSPLGAKLYFITPQDGETLSSPITIKFGLKGMGVAPAGMQKENTGHHHLIIDADLPPLDKPIPADDHYMHFGGGQTETAIALPPGPHTLQLLMGDFSHIPHDPPVHSDKITIIVK